MRSHYRIIRPTRSIPGVEGGYFVDLSAVAKPNSTSCPYCIPNEIICGEIGRLIGLPIPPLGLVSLSKSPGTQDIMFASLDFNFTGLVSLPDINPDVLVLELPRLSTGVLVFDILIANADRSCSNLSIDNSSANEPRLSVFDHGDALFGYSPNKGKSRLTELKDKLGITYSSSRHCLLDKLTKIEYFEEWFERIRLIPDYFLDDVCERVVDWGATNEEIEESKVFLKYRRDHIKHLVEGNKAEFQGIGNDLWTSMN